MRGGRKLVNGRLVGDHYSETGKNGLRVVVPEIRGILLNAFIRLVLTITSPEVIHWKIQFEIQLDSNLSSGLVI